jgi:hypothetical protein
MDRTTFLLTIAAGVITGLILEGFRHALRRGHLKRVALVIEGVFLFGAVGWFAAIAFFSYDPAPFAEPRPVNVETIREALASIIYYDLTPFGRFLMASGGLIGLVFGIWYPDKLRKILESGGKKQKPGGETEKHPH